MSIYGNFTIYAENINILLLKLNATCSISIQFSLYFLLQRNIITRDSIVYVNPTSVKNDTFFFGRDLSLKKKKQDARGHTACLCKNSTQFLETVFRVWNTKYLNNLVYLLIFQKLSNFSQLATLSPFVASVFNEKNEKNYLLYSDTCISCIYM